mgnify:FL=1
MNWEPAIYEHKARLIGRAPAEVSRSADLLEQALLAEHATYGADYLTVGIDVYNVEAEACGARIVAHDETACPEIPDAPWSIEDAAEGDLESLLVMPDIPGAGRFRVILEASRRAQAALSSIEQPPVLRVAASGPFSIASKLLGMEPLLIGAITQDPSTLRVLDFCTDLSIAWCTQIRRAGFEALIVDSSASPPMIGPEPYRELILPLHRRIMEALEAVGQERRPLILGGDTTLIAKDIVSAGATVVICDFAAYAADFAREIADRPDVEVRRNVAPGAIERVQDYEKLVEDTASDLQLFAHPILGTGILPYDQDPEPILRFRDAVAAAIGD